MNRPAVPNIQITGNVAVDTFIMGVIASTIWSAVVWLAAKLNFQDPEFAAKLFTVGCAAVAGAAAMAYTYVINKVGTAKAVQAGINLTVSGRAITTDGDHITTLGAPDATPPKPVTQASAAEIVKQFSSPN